MNFTVLGAKGFIGSNLAAELRRQGYRVQTPERDADLTGESLGHVFYCIGLTADFRDRPLDTIEAHVCKLAQVLYHADYESFLYLSSTRLYGKSAKSGEDTALHCRSDDPGDLYNISKMMGEAACFSIPKETVRVARLSNVFGPGMSPLFLDLIIREALERREILLNTTLESSKDYISARDVVSLLPMLAISGKQRIYNVASGVNTSNGQIIDMLKALTGCAVRISPSAERISFPPVSTQRIREEFGFQPRVVLAEMKDIVHYYRELRNEV